MITITVLPTVGRVTKITTDVKTLGELKPILTTHGLSTEGVSLIISETKNELSTDSALLPNTDFTLFIFPKNTKSGIHPNSILSVLRGLISTIEDLIDRVEDVVDYEDDEDEDDDYNMSDEERLLREEAEAFKREFDNN